MKKTILMVVIFATSFIQKTFAQDTADQSLQNIITAYLDVKNALIKDNADSASVYVKNLSSALHNIQAENLSAGQRKSWMKYYEVLINDASQMGSRTNLKNQRLQFADFSINFYKMLCAVKVNKADLYYQYCPMADAYWISENPKIENPYYGKEMPSCGSIKETLKAKQ